MSLEKGNLSINSDNIFPIIKKWLYSDHDIFIRELISNGSDAITKLKKLELMGETTLPEGEELRVDIIVDPEEKTITFKDNGIGMDADEVKQYINQIAFSGARDFCEKYKDKANEDQIIGHFGLGFYSAFMVAHKVTIDTLSYKPDAAPVHWESEEGMEFEMSEGSKAERGTTIVLYLNEDSYEFANEYRAKEVLDKYCSFMPVPIYFKNIRAKVEPEKVVDAVVDDEGKAVDADNGKADTGKEKPVNETHPLWTKHPNECSDEDYKKFYREVFHDYKEPLFWIHLNMDYPFNLKGILYFPSINMEYDKLEGIIKLYSNQVFIADNIKEVIPEFLLVLKGVIDCPDLPLNVSRSALQNDGFVKKISDYITKKVADKLSGLFKTDRANYEKYWNGLSPFVKFGYLRDEKFREKIKDFILYQDINGKYLTLSEYIEENKKTQDAEQPQNNTEDKAEGTTAESAEGNNATSDSTEVKDEKKNHVYYVTDEKQQSQYINMFRAAGLNAVILAQPIDQPFITQLEQADNKVCFQRIDADVAESIRSTGNDEERREYEKKLSELFKKYIKDEKLDIKVENIKNEKVASFITVSEESRRMQDMMRMYSMYGMEGNEDMFAGNKTLVLNANHPLVKYLVDHKKEESAEMIVKQLYDLARISNQPLAPADMTAFVERSNDIMMLLTK